MYNLNHKIWAAEWDKPTVRITKFIFNYTPDDMYHAVTVTKTTGPSTYMGNVCERYEKANALDLKWLKANRTAKTS